MVLGVPSHDAPNPAYINMPVYYMLTLRHLKAQPSPHIAYAPHDIIYVCEERSLGCVVDFVRSRNIILHYIANTCANSAIYIHTYSFDALLDLYASRLCVRSSRSNPLDTMHFVRLYGPMETKEMLRVTHRWKICTQCAIVRRGF